MFGHASIERLAKGGVLSDGLDRRAAIDTETVRALLLVNGGGATSLLVLLSSVLDTEHSRSLAVAIASGVVAFAVGLICAVVHNHFRRHCSRAYQDHNEAIGALLSSGTPAAINEVNRLRLTWKEPRVCRHSTRFMWASLAAFVLGSAGVALQVLIALW